MFPHKGPNFQHSTRSLHDLRVEGEVVFSIHHLLQGVLQALLKWLLIVITWQTQGSLVRIGTGLNPIFLLFFWDGELKSITPFAECRLLKVPCARFTRTGDFSSQLVHPALARSVSTLMGSLAVSRAKKLCPSVYLSRQVDAECASERDVGPRT